MGKIGKENPSEPTNTRFVDHCAKAQFQAAGWYRFLKKFSGENVAVAQAFAESFNGEHVKLGSWTFEISKTIIARATQLSATGESWYKRKTLFREDLNPYLKPEHENIDWTPTVHISYFKPERQGVITTVQRYITRESRLSIVH